MNLFSIFDPYPHIIAEISLRADGSMRVQDELDGNKTIIANKDRFLQGISIPSQKLVRLLLTHGKNIETVTTADGGRIIQDNDGLITTDHDIFLSVTVADCLPVFLYEPEKQIIALLHAGWKGLDKQIITEAIGIIKSAGGNPKKIIAAIGPSIGPCHFIVPEERAMRFIDRAPEAIKDLGITNEFGKNYSLNLKLIARKELEAVGVDPENIETHPDCTTCYSDKYFSYRADKTKSVQPMMAVFGSKKDD